MEPWLWAMQDADEAERRGDAAGALAVLQRRPLGPDGQEFWRPSRVYRLRQLTLLESFLPKWAVSRWILEQALQHLSERHGARARVLRAHAIVADLRGLPQVGNAIDDCEERAQVADHDWVYRQVHLFELGGIDAFLSDGASPDLIAGAEPIRAWIAAPMSGFMYAGDFGATLLWIDLATKQPVETPNIGSAIDLVDGECVIGRLVPQAEGVLFEDAPLWVPQSLARKVADDPSRWLELLRDSGLVADGTIHTATRDWAGLLSDVPCLTTSMVLAYRPDEQRWVVPKDREDLARATLELARATLDAREAEPCLRCDGVGLEPYDWELSGPSEPSEEECRECADDGWDAMAHMHAALLHPGVLEVLPGVLTEDDEPLLREVCDTLAEPARSWVASLLDAREAAA